MIRPNKRGPCRPELADAFLLALRYPEILRLHPLRFSPKVSSLINYRSEMYSSLTILPSLLCSPHGLPHLLTMDWAIWRKWQVQVLSRSIICFCFPSCPPVLCQDQMPWLMAAPVGLKNLHPSLDNPSKVTNDLTDIWQRNEGLLLQPLNLGAVYHTA